MLDFVKQRKKAGILAVAMSISVLVTGCLPFGDAGGTEPNGQATASVAERYADPEKYEEEATKAVRALYEDPNGKKNLFWLETDLLIKEVVYARTLIDQYNAGETPDAIKKEVELLVELSDQEFSSFVPYEKFIGGLNSIYNMVSNLDNMSFRYSRQCLVPVNTFLPKEERISHFNEDSEKYYDLAKLIHESCCEEDHSKQNERGYNYCPKLDGANEVARTNSVKPYLLILSE